MTNDELKQAAQMSQGFWLQPLTIPDLLEPYLIIEKESETNSILLRISPIG